MVALRIEVYLWKPNSQAHSKYIENMKIVWRFLYFASHRQRTKSTEQSSLVFKLKDEAKQFYFEDLWVVPVFCVVERTKRIEEKNESESHKFCFGYSIQPEMGERVCIYAF